METPELMADLAERLREHQVFGPAVERDGVTVVPVASVRVGGGVGGRDKASGGGGYGVVAKPAGAWVVKQGGDVTWQPAIDVNRAILGGQAVAALLLLLLMRLLRRR
jgi:uncharacterized spore protein YtfJ